MGFLRRREGIESWLEKAAVSYRLLNQREYGKVVSQWQERFDTVLAARDYVSGRTVEKIAHDLLPSDVFIFNVPGYHLLPAGTNARTDQAFGYEALQLTLIDFTVANPADAVIVDSALTFSCLCTHEAGELTWPQLAPASIVKRDQIY